MNRWSQAPVQASIVQWMQLAHQGGSEAPTAPGGGLRTVYDMLRTVDRGMVLTDVRREEKRGGRAGKWRRDHACWTMFAAVCG